MRVALSMMALLIASLAGPDRDPVERVMGDACRRGIFSQPRGNFALYVFCDGALGTNIGVILPDLDTPGIDYKSWTPGRHFWQDGPWATDVTSFAWDPFADRLYIGTSEIYGDGGVFALDLLRRTAERVLSTEEIDDETIRTLTANRRPEAHYGSIEEIDAVERTITVSIRFVDDEGSAELMRKVLPLGPAPVTPSP